MVFKIHYYQVYETYLCYFQRIMGCKKLQIVMNSPLDHTPLKVLCL